MSSSLVKYHLRVPLTLVLAFRSQINACSVIIIGRGTRPCMGGASDDVGPTQVEFDLR